MIGILAVGSLVLGLALFAPAFAVAADYGVIASIAVAVVVALCLGLWAGVMSRIAARARFESGQKAVRSSHTRPRAKREREPSRASELRRAS
jgi:hypothetical protein